MNSYTLNLSSSVTSLVSHVNTLYFDDFTKLNINLNGITENIIPLYIKIDWGIGESPIIFDNDLYRKGRDNVNILKFSPVLTNSYSYEYYPSSYALYKSLSAQVLVYYTNGDQAWFVIPINIRTFDYFESLEDIKLINSNILPLSGNPIEYQLISTKDNHIIELRNS